MPFSKASLSGCRYAAKSPLCLLPAALSCVQDGSHFLGRLEDVVAAVRVRWCLILLQPLIRPHQTTLRAWKGGQGGQGVLAASRTATKCQNPAPIPKVTVFRSNCWQDSLAVPVPHAESECQAAENNPFDFSKLGRLSETHQPVTRIVQNGCLLRFPQQKQHQKQQQAHYLVPFDKRGTNVPHTSYI